MEFILALVSILSAAWIVYATRDATRVMLFLLGAVSLAAVILTAWQRVLGMVPPVAAQTVIVLSMIGVASVFRRNHDKAPRFVFGAMLPLASVVVAVVFIVSRLLAANTNWLLFSGAGRLAYAEDNAKWLNFSANLAQSNVLNFKDGTTGGLAVLLVICGAFVWVISQLFLGGINVAGISIATVIGLHSFLIVISPLALTPIVTRFFPRDSGRATSLGRKKIFSVYAGLAASSLLVVVALGAVSTFGHLSLEVVMIQLLFWLAATVMLWNSKRDLLLVTLIGASTGLIWLPLPPLSAAIGIAAVIVAIVRFLRVRDKRDMYTVVGTAVLTVVLIWLTTPEMQYLSATTQPSSSTALVFAEGGTMAPRRYEGLLLVIAVLGAALYLWADRAKLAVRNVWQLYPFFLLFGFSGAVLLYDFVIARDGWPHYGARKLAYLVFVVCTAVLLPIALQGYQRIVRNRNFLAIAALVVSMVLVFQSRTMNQISYYTFKPGAWTNFDKRYVDGEMLQKYWPELINPENRVETSVDLYPIACVQVKDGIIQPGINDAYFCTRFLLSLHGAESYTNALFYPLLVAPNPDTILAMRTLPPEIMSMSVLVLDENGAGFSKISVEDYIALYEAQSEEMYSAIP